MKIATNVATNVLRLGEGQLMKFNRLYSLMGVSLSFTKIQEKVYIIKAQNSN